MLTNIYVPKADHSFQFDVESLPAESLQYVIEYGLRQAIVDTTAGVKRSDFTTVEEFNLTALAKAEKRVDQIKSGAVPGSRAPRVTRDVEAEYAKSQGLTVEQLRAKMAGEAETVVESVEAMAQAAE